MDLWLNMIGQCASLCLIIKVNTNQSKTNNRYTQEITADEKIWGDEKMEGQQMTQERSEKRKKEKAQELWGPTLEG